MFSRLRGLSRTVFDGRVLLLAPCNDIQTFTMRRAIDVAFVSQDGIVLESHRNVKPHQRLRNRRATVTLERFSRDDSWYEPGDCVSLTLPPKRFSCQSDMNNYELGSEKANSSPKRNGTFNKKRKEREGRSPDYEDMSRVR